MTKLQLKYRELKIISVIAASENISHAATVLGIAQANVSKYLADFESKVGLKVFDRTTRQLMLTPFGTALLPYINDMLDRNEQLNNFIADYKHEKRGQVTIYAPTGIITYLSKHVIDKIKDIGDITLSLKTCNLERNAFYEGVEFPDDCDVLISYAPPKDESLVASFITQYAVTAYASQRYLEKHPISRPDELEHHSCILIDSMMIDDANIWRFNVAGSKEVRDYRVKGNYVCDNTQSALELARNHLGIVFAPDKSVQSDLQDGTLVPCFQHPYEWWLDLVAIFRKREYQPWRVQYVLDEMLREIRHQLAQSQQLRPEQAAESED
ncbi:LysR family transcriptional regulator [Escherichia coli]|uniref:LysR family transcriptional regulator n=1 Tax=Escherichia coli TaxID=562 RepID=UPI001D0C3F5B|nr:LysR family transcriptional regulator [Escherichia coli]EHH4535833.1 LysR family transcriptional regulator [Escherichia coli]EJF8574790.1 LysR family transcriptional regulator [Escherichia coli]EKQ4325007.1 LysR family transcriptional regulator [Escherichia coli]EKQ4333920.1 LysR family transcriptional regulator [Escherichia coli]EKQ4439141.1 LysR family transcriptional regulator [Escherichia coli]